MDVLDKKMGPDDPSRDRVADINVDRRPYKVREGDWIVSHFKEKVGVDPAKVLAQVTHEGLKDLDDSETIKVKDGQKFVSHARAGGSS